MLATNGFTGSAADASPCCRFRPCSDLSDQSVMPNLVAMTWRCSTNVRSYWTHLQREACREPVWFRDLLRWSRYSILRTGRRFRPDRLVCPTAFGLGTTPVWNQPAVLNPVGTILHWIRCWSGYDHSEPRTLTVQEITLQPDGLLDRESHCNRLSPELWKLSTHWNWHKTSRPSTVWTAELANILSTEILARSTVRLSIRSIRQAEQGAAQNTATAGVFDLDIDSNGRWSVEKFKGLLFQIERDLNASAKNS